MNQEKQIYSITEITLYIKGLIEQNPALTRVYVRGEISNYKRHSSGHHYLTLKDEGAVLSCAMFRSDAAKMRFQPENGMKVIAHGRIGLFPRNGQYQLYIDTLVPDGVGDLALAFEQLKKKLQAEGLFDPERKKVLPQFPEKIALITSPTGAAVRDMIRILKKRFPIADVLVCPVHVQGGEAAGEIAEMIHYVNQKKMADVIIVGRGGGSMEDLWAFNCENVARAIAKSVIPVVSAVGHEPDVTISDFVADVRAATPSNAAEITVPDQAAVLQHIAQLEFRSRQMIQNRLSSAEAALRNMMNRRVLKSPAGVFEERKMLLDLYNERMSSALQQIMSRQRERFCTAMAKVDALSPLKVLARGYSIVMNTDGKVLKTAESVKIGEMVQVRIKKGTLCCEVKERQK